MGPGLLHHHVRHQLHDGWSARCSVHGCHVSDNGSRQRLPRWQLLHDCEVHRHVVLTLALELCRPPGNTAAKWVSAAMSSRSAREHAYLMGLEAQCQQCKLDNVLHTQDCTTEGNVCQATRRRPCTCNNSRHAPPPHLHSAKRNKRGHPNNIAASKVDTARCTNSLSGVAVYLHRRRSSTQPQPHSHSHSHTHNHTHTHTQTHRHTHTHALTHTQTNKHIKDKQKQAIKKINK